MFSPTTALLRRSVLARYGFAVGAVMAAVLVRAAFTRAIGPTDLPFITFFPAVAIAAWYGRLRPAIVCVALSVLAADWFFIEPIHSFSIGSLFSSFALLAFAFAAAVIVAAIESMHRVRARLAGEIEKRERAQTTLAVTLTSIGDGVIATDALGCVTFLNPEAQRLTGWTEAEAKGRPLPEVFRICNEQTRRPAENPVEKVLRTGNVVGLANHTVLVAKNGIETPIDDSAAPMRHPDGSVSGVVLVFRDVTEQRKAQEAKAQLAAIVEQSGEVILTKDLDGLIQTWNASAERLFGYSPAEIVGKPVTVLVPPECASEEAQLLDRIRLGQPVERLETIRVAKDGRRIPVAVSISPVRNSHGELIGASKVLRDITDLVAAREALVREKELLATTLASIGDAVIATDAQGRITFLNAEAERLTGWTSVEAAGRPLPEVFRIVNEETRTPVENPVEKVLRIGGVVGLANHTLLIARDGTETSIDDSAAPILLGGVQLAGVVLVFRDFTKHKEAEQAVRASEERLRVALTAGRMGTWEWTVSTGRVIWSSTLEDIHGLKRGAFGGTLADFKNDVHPDDLEFLSTEIRKALETGRDYHVVYRIRRPDETVRWLEAFGTVLLGARGEPEKLAGVCMDITERKQAEQTLRDARDELARVNASLDKAVHDRTARLEEMIRELQHVSYAIAHDMRAPLRAMGAFAEILVEEAATHGTTAVAQDYCRRIITAAGRLDILIRDALSYSRTVLQQPPLEPVDLARLVRGLLESYPNFHADKADIAIDGHLPIVLGNESLLTQCFSNLLGNAVKFVATGTRPRVRVRVSEPQPGVTRVWIEDNGIGIPEHAQPRLFGMFQKLDNRYEGTGIGLAIVRKVVERMDGKVGVESLPDQGSRFWVDLRTVSVERVN